MVVVVVSVTDEEEGPSPGVVPALGETDGTEMTTVKLEVPEVGTGTVKVTELNEERAELSDEGTVAPDVVLGSPGTPWVDEPCVVLRELMGPVDRLCWLLVTVEDVLVVGVSTLMEGCSVVCDVD